MRKRFCIFLICAVVLIAGCNAGTPDAELGKSVSGGSRKVEAAGENGTAEQAASKKETAKEESAGAKKGTADKKKSSSETEAAETDADQSADKKDQKDTAEQKTEEKAAEKKKEEKTAEKKKEEKAEEEKKEEETTEKKKEEETTEKKKEEKTAEKKEEEKKEEKKKEEKKKYEEVEQYIPDGFTPYGSYVLIYDDGYEVKTRYTAAGLTYYYESEEFFFKLNKDLPDMKREVAHILFNTTAPMDPSNTEGEEFPYEVSYMIYISLDDGSYYEVSRWNLDLEGRVFVRDIFETFRQEWEGKM